MIFQLKSERENNYSKALNYSVNLLSKLPRTEKQLREKLFKREYEDLIIDDVISELKELNYINDMEYAVNYLNSRLEKDGPHKIKAQLYNKGISKAIIEEVLSDWNREDEFKTAYESAVKKTAVIGRSIKAKGKLARFLQGRGFSYEIVQRVVSEIYSDYDYSEGEEC